jgi:hypothetical protein
LKTGCKGNKKKGKQKASPIPCAKQASLNDKEEMINDKGAQSAF